MAEYAAPHTARAASAVRTKKDRPMDVTKTHAEAHRRRRGYWYGAQRGPLLRIFRGVVTP